MKRRRHTPSGVVFHFFLGGVGAVVGHGCKSLLGWAPARFKVQVWAAGETCQPGFGDWPATTDGAAKG